MILLHPKILSTGGKKEFAVIPYGEFQKIQEQLEDFETLKVLRCAKEKEKYSKTIPLSQVRKAFSL